MVRVEGAEGLVGRDERGVVVDCFGIAGLALDANYPEALDPSAEGVTRTSVNTQHTPRRR